MHPQAQRRSRQPAPHRYRKDRPPPSTAQRMWVVHSRVPSRSSWPGVPQRPRPRRSRRPWKPGTAPAAAPGRSHRPRWPHRNRLGRRRYPPTAEQHSRSPQLRSKTRPLARRVAALRARRADHREHDLVRRGGPLDRVMHQQAHTPGEHNRQRHTAHDDHEHTRTPHPAGGRAGTLRSAPHVPPCCRPRATGPSPPAHHRAEPGTREGSRRRTEHTAPAPEFNALP
jgi:hypothetical protein